VHDARGELADRRQLLGVGGAGVTSRPKRRSGIFDIRNVRGARPSAADPFVSVSN
jgi:hypothetical protein